MAKMRLNDTAAIAAAPPRGGESHHISTRAVSNGYIVCESTSNDSTGEYKSSERFYEECPRVIPPRIARGKVGGESDLSGAMDYLRDPVTKARGPYGY